MHAILDLQTLRHHIQMHQPVKQTLGQAGTTNQGRREVRGQRGEGTLYFAAFLHMMTGPNWQWSPTRITCLAPSTIGTMHSGSVACNTYNNT